MLLLVTIGLVLVGAVSLVIGFVSNSLAPIYLSIACSVIAGIVLVVFSRMSKRQEAGGPSSSGFTPAPSAGSWTPPPAPSPAPAPVPSYRAPSTPAPVEEPEPAASPARGAPVAASAVALADFPLEGYDTLRVSQILPALEALDLDQLDTVREREEQGKNRTTVLRRIDVLMDEQESEDGGAAASAVAAAPVMDEDEDQFEDDEEGLEEEIEDNFLDGASDLGGASDLDDDDYEDEAEVGEPTAVVPAVAPSGDSFPIPGYDSLPVAQILPLLDDLDDDELDRVAEYEEQGKNRAAILDRIDDMFEPVDDEAPPPPPPAPVAVPSAPVARKAPAKKAPAKAKKATAGKTAAIKVPAAGKAPAKKAAVKKAAVKKAAPVASPTPVTRTATRKAVAAKKPPAVVKKAPAKKR